MKVLKFGGTSVGSNERMVALNTIIQTVESPVVVLSARAGTTNALVEIVEYGVTNKALAIKRSQELHQEYKEVVKGLLNESANQKRFLSKFQTDFETLESWIGEGVSKFSNQILALGEQWSTSLFVAQGQKKGIAYVLHNSLDFIVLDRAMERGGEPNFPEIERRLAIIQQSISQGSIPVFQGFICTDSEGEVANLKRGGSDYSAAIIGAALNVEEVQIWTDVDGFCVNDPRVVKNPRVLKELSYKEAAELAYFGAKILHPATILPCRKKNIPVRLKNTLSPSAPGTLIHADCKSKSIRAVAAKDGITVLKIYSSRMLLAHGFLSGVFQVFSKHETAIDMIATSEVSVSLTIDDEKNLGRILEDLKQMGTVEIEQNQTIVSVVGDFSAQMRGLASQILQVMEGIPLGMISYGGSQTNISFVVPEDYKKQSLQSLNVLVEKEFENELV